MNSMSCFRNYMHLKIKRLFSDGREQRTVRILMLPFVMCLLITSSSCSGRPTNAFPEVSFPEYSSNETESSVDPSINPSVSSSLPVIRVAAPISTESAKYLSLLFAAKEQGLLPEGENGSTISLDYLLSIEPGFYVETTQTPSTGATYDMVKQWENDGLAPDIMYVHSLSPFIEKKEILSLNASLANVTYITPDRIYPQMLDVCTKDNQLYGIPYAASAQILFWNQEVLDLAENGFLPFTLSLSEFTALADAVTKLNVSEVNVETSESSLQEPDMTSSEQNASKDLYYAFYEPSKLLPTLPNSFDSSIPWFSHYHTGFSFDTEEFQKSTTFLRSFSSGTYFSVESMTTEDRTGTFGMMDPRITGRVAGWAGETLDIAFWSSTLPSVSISMIPTASIESTMPLALTVYPLCVSANTQNSDIVTEFASFLAMDEDAILLTDRLESRIGFIPVVSSDAVWRISFEKKEYGDRIIQIKDSMPDAIYNPQTNEDEVALKIQAILERYGSSLLDPEQDPEVLIKEMSAYANDSV